MTSTGGNAGKRCTAHPRFKLYETTTRTVHGLKYSVRHAELYRG